jgi:hypothetical protein
MRRKIHELDFDAIVQTIAKATDKSRRIACVGPIHTRVRHISSPSDAWEMLRNGLLQAIVRHAQSLEDVTFEQPLVQALVRAQHHPLAKPVPMLEVEGGLRGPDVSPKLNGLAAAHPELGWDLEEIQKLVIRAIREYGDHELDDREPPWQMHWDRASAAATALIYLVTLRALGDIA